MVDMIHLNVVALAGSEGHAALGGGHVADVEIVEVLHGVGVNERSGGWFGRAVGGGQVNGEAIVGHAPEDVVSRDWSGEVAAEHLAIVSAVVVASADLASVGILHKDNGGRVGGDGGHEPRDALGAEAGDVISLVFEASAREVAVGLAGGVGVKLGGNAGIPRLQVAGDRADSRGSHHAVILIDFHLDLRSVVGEPSSVDVDCLARQSTAAGRQTVDGRQDCEMIIFLQKRRPPQLGARGRVSRSQVLHYLVLSALLHPGLMAGYSFIGRGGDWSLDNVEPAAESVSDVHGYHVAHVPVAVAEAGDPVDAVEVDVGASGSRSGEECMDDRSVVVQVREAALLVGEGLLLAVAEHIDGQVGDVAALARVGGDARESGLCGAGGRDHAGVRTNAHLIVGCVDAKSNSGDVKDRSASNAARRSDDFRGRARDRIKLQGLVPYVDQQEDQKQENAWFHDVKQLIKLILTSDINKSIRGRRQDGKNKPKGGRCEQDRLSREGSEGERRQNKRGCEECFWLDVLNV